MSDQFKHEVLTAFQKVSPSRINIEDDETLQRYISNHYNLFFHKLKFPTELFKGKNVLDFGCGTGEVDVVLASWGAYVQGIDFNPVSIERASELSDRFGLSEQMAFSVGDIETFDYQAGSFDLAVSFGVIPHVPNQRHMFHRMADATRPGGYVMLGYVEDAGLIQRLLHRAIVRANADKSDEEIFRIAQTCFAEHIDRSVRFGGRTAASVINDYLVNPHYIGLSSNTLVEWAADTGLEFYSSWPNADLPFVADSPYFAPISRVSPIYRMFVSLNRLRWIFAQRDDATVFGELEEQMHGVSEKIETLLASLTEMLQTETYTTDSLDDFHGNLEAVAKGVARAGHAIADYANRHLTDLGGELERILTLVVRKAQDGTDFDLKQVHGRLFKGYNGLGTSYTIFHKPE